MPETNAIPSQPVTRADVEVLNTNLGEKWHGTAWLIRIHEQHYVVSAVEIKYPPLIDEVETMVFASDAEGVVSDYSDLACTKTWDHERAIALLIEELGGR